MRRNVQGLKERETAKRITDANGEIADLKTKEYLTKSYGDTIYIIAAGKAGGQTVKGGTASGDDLILESTSHATKGQVIVEAGTNVNIGPDALATNVFNISHASAAMTIIRYVNSTSGPVVILRKSRNATVGSHTIVQSGDELGRVDFRGSDGAAFIDGAQIMALVDGTPGTNDMPGRIEFRTTPDGSTIPVLRVTIDKDGNVILISGSILSAETIRAIDSSGLILQDSGGNSRISIADAGDVIIRTSSTAGSDFVLRAADAHFLQNIDGTTTYQKIDATGTHIGGSSTAAAKLQVTQPTLGSIVQRLQSTATNDDPTEDIIQNRVATTDATVTTLHTITISSGKSYLIKAHVLARRTGGASGTANDSAAYGRVACVKDVSGTATLVGAVASLYTMEDQAGWDVTIDVTGGTARVRVTGAASNNVTWHLERLEVAELGT